MLGLIQVWRVKLCIDAEESRISCSQTQYHASVNCVRHRITLATSVKGRLRDLTRRSFRPWRRKSRTAAEPISCAAFFAPFQGLRRRQPLPNSPAIVSSATAKAELAPAAEAATTTRTRSDGASTITGRSLENA